MEFHYFQISWIPESFSLFYSLCCAISHIEEFLIHYYNITTQNKTYVHVIIK